ncbi:DNA-processing protein DprA [Burkholderia seminalis]|uniref:DNA-processing protein DprA n=1 Tax=Burkholderia seminalis TaxID=488731 RepID=UPI001452F411|nr:DNA-processing protein DprA [Burkholderia seminalis]MCA8430082.1 DNA-protecting protein DprA [Burkholderia seminalis]VWB16872.1 DNA processing protein DprA [Burkholderia seminalis]
MTNSDLSICVVAQILLRACRISPGAASALLLKAPVDQMVDELDLIEWCESQGMPRDKVGDEAALAFSKKSISETVEAGIDVIPVTSDHYPVHLKLIEDAPPVIYSKGNRELLSAKPGVSVVGTRKASPNGLRIAERIAGYFAERQWTIVSGLALGIDAAAHRGALGVSGATVAVLAHGLHHATPKANAHLANDILANGGAWVSEHPINVPALPEQFVQRNRIQIGLSAGSIIVEGEERSGTMTQAEFCLRNRRQLFAVLPEKADELKLVSKGPLILINRRGATPLRSRDDYESAAHLMEVKRAMLASLPLTSSS